MKPLINAITLSVCLSATCYNLEAQFSHTIFYDTLTTITDKGFVHSALTNGKFLYLAGSSFSDTTSFPTLTKMDTSGKVIWTAVDYDNYERFGNYWGFETSKATCKDPFKSGQRLYTIAQTHNPRFENPNEVWCIDDSTGVLLWKVNVNQTKIVRIADYSSTEMLAITGVNSFYYHIIDKATGKVLFSKKFGSSGRSAVNEPYVLVDNNQDVLLSWDDTCRKFRDNRLSNLLWTSVKSAGGRVYMVDRILQDSGRYILMGNRVAISVDSLNASTVWLQRINVGQTPGQSGTADGNPKDYILKDSLLYITWTSPFVGGVDLELGFTLTAVNKFNGSIKFNTAYDFLGIPPDPAPVFVSELDWPFKICLDANNNLYMTGSYDQGSGMEDPGNWGIMKFNGFTGKRIYDATITDDSTKRSNVSQGRFITYYNGRIYCIGNLQKKNTTMSGSPVVVAFDTTATYNEYSRIIPRQQYRYPSALISLQPFGKSKMILLKKLGRSTVVEMRTNTNLLLWSKTFSSKTKFTVPQHLINLGDTGVAVSFTVLKEDTLVNIFPAKPDSLVFARLDSLGSIDFLHRVWYDPDYHFSALQGYTDTTGKTNFIFIRRNMPNDRYTHYGYTLGGRPAQLSFIGLSQFYETDSVYTRLTPLQHFHGDTMIFYQSGSTLGSVGWLYSTTDENGGYRSLSNMKPLRNFARVYSALKLDSVSYLIMGRDSSGQLRADRYNHRLPNPIVWSYTVSNGSTFNADNSVTSLYTVSRINTGSKLVISKLNKQTGLLAWNKEKVQVDHSAYIPVDFKFDTVNNYFIIGGFITDSSIAGVQNSYFYMTVDSSGNIIKDVIKPGYGLNHTRIGVVNVLQNGATLFGGTLNTADNGIVGFYNSDCFVNNLIPAVTITTSTPSVCKDSSITFVANAIHAGSQPVYQWQVNGINRGANSDTFKISTVQNGDQVKLLLTSNADCRQSSNATSNIINITVGTTLVPAVNITGNAVVSQGQSTVITASPTNGGSNPVYQWQKSMQSGAWTVIAGEVSNTINYTPASTGDKILCILKSSAGCANPETVVSNQITFTVNVTTGIPPVPAGDYGIISYPNPTSNWITIDSLKLRDSWQTLEIITIDSRQYVLFMNISNRTRVTLPTERLSTGTYIAILRRRQGAPVYLKFVKL